MGGGNEDSETQLESEAKDAKKIIDDNGTPDVSRRESPDNLPTPPELTPFSPNGNGCCFSFNGHEGDLKFSFIFFLGIYLKAKGYHTQGRWK